MADRAKQVGAFGSARLEMEHWWKLCRALRGGTIEMRRRGVEYLPKDAREVKHPHLYEARIARSVLFAAYDDTITKIASRPFQKPVTVGKGLPAPLDKIERNADREGTSLTAFAWSLFEDGIDRGMWMFLVDHVPTRDAVEEEFDEEIKPAVESDDPKKRRPAVTRKAKRRRNLNAEEEEAADARPYFVRIAPDNLVGFRHEKRAGRDVVTELRLREWTYRSNPDFTETLIERVRVWTEQTFEVWERDYGTTSVDPADRDALAGQGESSSFTLKEGPTPHLFPGGGIPIVVGYTRKLGTLFARPPLENLQWLNVAHWQSDSQQRTAVHYARNPILKGSGVDHDTAKEPPEIGAGATVVDTSDKADWSYVEIGGASLEAGRKELEELEQRMHSLGMSPMVETNGPDTATGEMRAETKQQSQAQTWAEALEWSLYEGYQLAARWRGKELPKEWTVSVFREFAMVAGRQADLPAIAASQKDGIVTKVRRLIEEKKRGLWGDDLDPEKEVAMAEAEAPPPPVPFGGGDPDDPDAEMPPEEGEKKKQVPPPAKKEAKKEAA